jgi:hypothetical protein
MSQSIPFIGCVYLYTDGYCSYKYVILSIEDGKVEYIMTRYADCSVFSFNHSCEKFNISGILIKYDDCPISNEII